MDILFGFDPYQHIVILYFKPDPLDPLDKDNDGSEEWQSSNDDKFDPTT